MAEKLKTYKKKLVLPQYSTVSNEPYTVLLVVTDNVNEYVEKSFPNLSDTKQGACHVYRNYESHIILPFDASISTVVHECWHCVYRIMKTIGAELENEVVAYTLGWITEQATDFLYSTPEYKKLAVEQLKKLNSKKPLTKRKTKRKV